MQELIEARLAALRAAIPGTHAWLAEGATELPQADHIWEIWFLNVDGADCLYDQVGDMDAWMKGAELQSFRSSSYREVSIAQRLCENMENLGSQAYAIVDRVQRAGICLTNTDGGLLLEFPDGSRGLLSVISSRFETVTDSPMWAESSYIMPSGFMDELDPKYLEEIPVDLDAIADAIHILAWCGRGYFI